MHSDLQGNNKIRVNTSMISPTFNQAESVRRAKLEDHDAFLELVEHFDRRIFRVAKQITQNNKDAEEVLIETFLKACSHLDHCQDDTKFGVWIVSIAANKAVTRLRGRWEDQAPVDDGAGSCAQVVGEISGWRDNPQDRYSRNELARILDQAMETLPPRDRGVLVLREMEEMSIGDIAQALTLSISEVKCRLLRSRLQLREKLTQRMK